MVVVVVVAVVSGCFFVCLCLSAFVVFVCVAVLFVCVLIIFVVLFWGAVYLPFV